MSLQTDSFLENYGFNFDFDTCINVRSNKEGNDVGRDVHGCMCTLSKVQEKTFNIMFQKKFFENITDESVMAHKLVLSSASTQFRNLLANRQPEESVVKIDVDLREIPNSINAFKAMLNGLYTGELNYTQADHAEILAVARHCQVPTIESKLLAVSQDSNSLTALLSQPEFSIIALSPPISTEESSSPIATPTVFNEKIIPNDDKEGWCRNKKYIEKVEGGFMCTVCRKIYGRYNSVSYHVTIYHRNPPIRCDEAGCQFSTREARYIHFHKYYRHHIPLPDSIDLGSRKCPFCRHVSKSPAMLEKHIARHVPEKKGRMIESYSCDQCMYRY
ncbi:unnamed protein product [Angiostrongylus costaricensis]|uniref:BTB domain-containing protein n=1 Tax=Angiostrongylus costaricensis TaxID=334426 RepID=A0A0R3PTG7_ANGCS|nr:unnamed protein product [Angiostrongylus costaricensis]